MSDNIKKLLTIVTEAALENILIKDIERLGAQGYTITDARGKGCLLYTSPSPRDS